MHGANVLTDQHQALAEHFLDLAQTRGQLPVFAIEHGLDDPAVEELRKAVSRQIEEDPQLAGAAWAWNYLPLLVIATEVGYRYRGTGTDFWPVLSQELGVETGPAFRSGLSRLFELGHNKLRLARPGDSPWERHFPHISWPIGNSLVPLEIQPQLTDALRRAVRAGVSADDTDRLLDYLRALAAGHASRRFENWLLQRDVALEVMRRLLAPASEGWLSGSLLARVDRDIRKDWRALRAITEARKTVARRTARLTQITASRYVLALRDDEPKHLGIRGPTLPAQLRDEVIAALGIHGDRIRAVDGIHVISLRAFLAGGEIVLKNIAPFPMSPLRRDDAVDLDEGIAKTTLERLQPLEPEYFAVEPNGLAAHAVFPGEKLQPDTRILQLIHAGEDDNVETRTLETSNPSDIEFLRRRGFVIADRVSTLRVAGLPAPGASTRFIDDFPVLVSQRGVADAVFLLDGAVTSGDLLSIGGADWKAIRPVVGLHLIEPAEGRELDRLEFEVVEPPDIEPAMVKLLPANVNVSDLETGRLEIRVTAPLALEAVPIRIRVVSPNEPALVVQGVIDRLPARLTGRSPVLHEIQTKLAGQRANETGLRLHVEAEGLLEKVFLLPPVRREIRYDGETGEWTRGGEDAGAIPSITATVVAPLLGAAGDRSPGTRLVLPDAADHEALTAGLILSGSESTRLVLGDRRRVSLPALLREPTSNEDGVGIIELARANVAWQLAEANDLLGTWQRWSVVEELEAALIEQLCGARWRRLEAGIDHSILSPHGALLRCADALGLVSGEDLPNIETAHDKEFLRERLTVRLREAVPDISEALLQWTEDLAGELDLAVIEAYEDLRQKLEADGIEAFDEVDMARPANSWRDALERSREIPLFPMFRPFILPEARWLALVKPSYSELTEDDLVDLLDSTHVDASRRPGLRWLGRSEIRTMLQLWLSPKAMVETEDWREFVAKGLSDIRTSRAVRYVALRRKFALGDLPNGTTV
ncbi:hypothetical protein [Amorphus coralli]|uniref:hypothetical protein n=1 Tax=Amorphus coralli TaxID=340680 RepID=UPI00040FF192|nr:hypothetical protein [Amorphus coralli]